MWLRVVGSSIRSEGTFRLWVTSHGCWSLSVLFPSEKIGTYQMAVMAKALNKPFYVVAESFKFVRMFPLNQDDLPNREKVLIVR